MKRKPLYLVLLLPFLLFGVALLAMPAFRMEFVHNVRGMIGMPAEYKDGKTLGPEERDDVRYNYGGGVPLTGPPNAGGDGAAESGDSESDTNVPEATESDGLEKTEDEQTSEEVSEETPAEPAAN